MPPGFLAFKAKHIRKINAQRRALSQPTIMDVPTLTTGQAMYIGHPDGKPASCYTCPFYNYGRSCKLMGPDVPIKKFIYPPKATADAKRIEYWPCCSEWIPGKPNMGSEVFVSNCSPGDLGLGWINAPEVGQEYGGANCGGANGGDDCDSYMTKGPDKRAEPTAFCRVLQQNVDNCKVCAAWMDDDWMSYDRARNIMKELKID